MLRFGRFLLPFIAIILLNFFIGECEMSIYPGLRRRPQLHAQLLNQQQPLDDFLNQLMEENARRRLQQQFEQQLHLINMQMARQRQRQERLRERLRQQQLQLQQQRQDIQDFSAEDQDNVDYNNNHNSRDNNNNFGSIMNNNNNNNNDNLNMNMYEQYGNLNGDFGYKYPKLTMEDADKLLQQPIQFAVSPLDPRYYLDNTAITNDVSNDDDETGDLDSKALDEYEEYVPAEASKPAAAAAAAAASAAAGEASSNQQSASSGILLAEPNNDKNAVGNILAPAPVLAPVPVDAAATTFHRIKPQTAAAAAVAGVNIKQNSQHQQPETASNNIMRHDINALISKLQKEGKSSAILNGANDASLAQDVQQQQMVVRQHMGMVDSDMGMYIVALIAGVSAATTVGLIALGIAWVHNKAKAAADVEYPAYGITGPNKDISPSGDRKLAQSAQMYHYQHQKQQIIAMENRQAAEGSCGLSDVESDDDNEEGDYTVYECPGLAPTAEMEVKNPLFLDETPVTPLAGNVNVNHANAATDVSSITQATAQQPPQQQLGKKASPKGAGTITMNSSSDGKNSKAKKHDKK